MVLCRNVCQKFPLMLLGAKPRVQRAQNLATRTSIGMVENSFFLLLQRPDFNEKIALPPLPCPNNLILTGKWVNFKHIPERLIVASRDFLSNLQEELF